MRAERDGKISLISKGIITAQAGLGAAMVAERASLLSFRAAVRDARVSSWDSGAARIMTMLRAWFDEAAREQFEEIFEGAAAASGARLAPARFARLTSNYSACPAGDLEQILRAMPLSRMGDFSVLHAAHQFSRSPEVRQAGLICV